jgi:hypothetical protein
MLGNARMPSMPGSKRTTGEHAVPEPARAQTDSPWRRELIADITRRLRPVGAGMPPDECEGVVRRAAEATSRWETGTARIGRTRG